MNQMQNMTLSFFQKRTPYIKELRVLCKDSTDATLLMQSMEYYFTYNQDGFYKFLSPCSHDLYRAGDSWCEELGFSERSMRTALDKICIRYQSIKQLNHYTREDENGKTLTDKNGKAIQFERVNPFEILNARGEVVGEAMYYSYIDAIKRVTFYHRNHALTDRLLREVIANYSPDLPPSPRPEKKKRVLHDGINGSNNAQNPPNCAYRSYVNAPTAVRGNQEPQLNLPNCASRSYVSAPAAVRYNKEAGENNKENSKQYSSTYQDGKEADQQKPIDSAAANFLVSENETEKQNTDCQAQLPVTEQSSVAAAAEKPVDHVSVVDAEQATDGEVTQATEPQPTAKPTQRTSHSQRPVKPVVQEPSNAKASNVVEPVIGKSLTDGQMAALVRLAESINTAKPELGVTVQDLERTILNPRAFRECRNQFLKKGNTIKKMALDGRWSPSEAQKPPANRSQWSPDTVAARHSVTADVSDSTNPAVMAMRNRESVDGRVSMIQNSIASIKSTFSDRMSKHRGRQFFVGQMNAIEEKKAMLLELGVDPTEVERLCDVSDLVRNIPQMQENVAQFPVMNDSTPIQRQAVGVGK